MQEKFININAIHYDNIFITKKNKLNFLYNYNLFFFGNFEVQNKNMTYFDKTTNTTIKNNKLLKYNYKNKNRKMKLFLTGISYFFIKKIRFTGKGYRIKKSKRGSFKFYFGHSHNTYFFSGGLSARRNKKHRLTMFSNNLKKMNTVAKRLSNIKQINIYTKRGLRCKRQLIFKRLGKKSTY
jgi:ribosomal protein L6P/L9E